MDKGRATFLCCRLCCGSCCCSWCCICCTAIVGLRRRTAAAANRAAAANQPLHKVQFTTQAQSRTCLLQDITNNLVEHHLCFLLCTEHVCLWLSGHGGLQAFWQGCIGVADARCLEYLADKLVLLLGACLQHDSTTVALKTAQLLTRHRISRCRPPKYLKLPD